MKKAIELKDLYIEALVSVSPQRKIEVAPDGVSNKIQRLAKNIGIKSKRVCSKDQYFSDLAQHGILDIIKRLDITTDDIDALIVVTQSPDYIIPGVAVLLQDRCGLPVSTIAYDINLGCSGMPYGIFVAHGHLLSGLNRVLVIGGDQSFSEGTKDEGHGVLFGDGCSVASITLKEENTYQKSYFSAGTDGSGYQSLYIPHGGRRRPINKASLIPRDDGTGVIRSGIDVVLDGPKILTFSVKVAPREIQKILDCCDWDKTEVDYFFLHQANRMINETIRKKVKLEINQCPETLSDFGNTSVASATITMTARASSCWNSVSAKSIICTFGIGLSWSTISYQSDGDEISAHIYV